LDIAEKEHQMPKEFITMIVYCKNCVYRGFKGSRFCTYEDRYINTGEYCKTKREKNLKGKCRNYKPLWWKFWLSENPQQKSNNSYTEV
jgi:hypothetical protein